MTEKMLRETLDKMQLSHLKSGEDEFYIRSTPYNNQNFMLANLGIKELQPMIPIDSFKL